MTKKVDEKKTKRALRKLRKAVEEAEARGETVKFSDWEEEFTVSLEERLTKFGSAFRDRAKGDPAEPLSYRQKAKLGEIARKARGKGGGLTRTSSLTTRKPMKRGGKTFEPRVRHIEDDLPPDEPERPSGPPAFKVIKGGKDDDA